MNRHPLRWLYERLGLVRTEDEIADRFKHADRAMDEATQAVNDARRRRGLTVEVQSYRHREGQRR